ncbi:MAG: hypothetical protein IKH59_02175 [Bacteroidaceae bacterium]|nr:hypothetical protein [Bacteroidaceae bacterium]
MKKRKYTTPQMEEMQMRAVSLLAMSGAEQTDMGVFPSKEEDASNALANPFRRRGF